MDNIYEVKHNVIVNLELELAWLEKYLANLISPPKGLYVRGKRFPFTHEEHGLFIYPNMVPLDLDGDLPTDINLNIVNKNSKLIASGYNINKNPLMFSTKPHHAVLSLDFLSLLVDFLQYSNNQNKSLYFTNLLNKKDDYLIRGEVKNMTFIEDVIHYCFNGYDVPTMRSITDHVYRRIVPMLNDYMMMDTGALYTLKTDKVDIVIRKHNDIRAIRYMMSYDEYLIEEEIRNV